MQSLCRVLLNRVDIFNPASYQDSLFGYLNIATHLCLFLPMGTVAKAV